MEPLKCPPGERIIRLCKKSVAVKRLLKHFEIETLANEYYILWHEAQSDSEKEQVHSEYVRQLALACLVPFGIHAGEAALIHVLYTNPMFSIGFFIVVIAVWSLIRRLR
jgi:hypothetical protein